MVCHMTRSKVKAAEVCRLADVVNMLIERHFTGSDDTQTLNTARCLDVNSSGDDCRCGLIPVVFHSYRLQLLQSSQDSGTVHWGWANDEVLWCTLSTLTSCHPWELNTSAYHLHIACGRFRKNWSHRRQQMCTEWRAWDLKPIPEGLRTHSQH